MTIKIKDLAVFMKTVKEKHNSEKISRRNMRFEIANHFGASRPTIADKLALLQEFGFMRISEDSHDVFIVDEDNVIKYG